MYSKSAATIDDLINSAQTLFLRKNYADLTMDDVAAAAGVTKGAIYHHFGSKESLYVTMMLSFLEELQALFQAAIEGGGTCKERLRRLTQVFLELPREKRDLMKLVRRDINTFKDPVRSQLVEAYHSALPEQIELITREGMQNGELPPGDARLLSWLYVANVEVILTPYAEHIFDSQKETLEFVMHLFFKGADTPFNLTDSKG
jgi:AcrR family transcriptional regulator